MVTGEFVFLRLVQWWPVEDFRDLELLLIFSLFFNLRVYFEAGP